MPSEIAPATVAEVLGTDTATPPPAPMAAAVETDSLGRVFDSAKFATDDAGRPRRDKLGRFFSRFLGGRKPAATPPPSAAPAGSPPPAAPAPDLSDIERAARGEQPAAPSGAAGAVGDNATVETALGLIQILLVLAGDEEGVLSPAEKLLLRPPLLRIMAKYEIGADVLPAEVELLFALAGIVIERVKRGGKTATTFAKCKAWLAGLFFKARGAQIGAQMRREVPADLVAGLRAQVERLQAELAAAKAAPAGGVV